MTGKDGVTYFATTLAEHQANIRRARGSGRVTVNGETRVTGLIGDPVAHSRSPAILNAAYREAGLNWVYVAFPVPAGHGGDAVKAARRPAALPV